MTSGSRSRKQKKQSSSVRRVSGRRAASPYAGVLAGVEALRAEDSVLAAEAWASGLVGVMWAAGSADAWADPDDILDARFGELVDYLVSEGSSAALAALRALALVGDGESRERAAAGAEGLARDGVPEPAWAQRADSPELIEAHAVGDLFGDLEVILLAFQRPKERHSVLVFLDHASGGGVAQIAFGPYEDGLVAVLAESIRHEAACTTPVRMTGAEARARLGDALDRFLAHGPNPAGAPEQGDEDDPTAGWAMLRARLDSLPDDLIDTALDAEIDQQELTVERFLASAYAEGLPDQEVARIWAAVAVDSALDAGRSAHQYGPLSLSFLLTVEMTEHLDIDAADLDLLPDVVTAWAHFTADVCGLGEHAHRLWDEALPGLLASFAEAYADAESAQHRATCSEVVAFRSYGAGLDPAAALGRLQALLPPGLRGHLDQAALAPAPGPLPAAGIDAGSAVHQLKIKLRRTRPPVWRRVEVASTTTLADLHDVIQASFGWDDDHLWEFDTAYGKHGPVPNLGHQDPHQAALAQVAPEGSRLSYVFDFGDHWDHEITVEKIVPAARAQAYPRCTGGRQPDPSQYSTEDDDYLAVPFRRELIDARLAALRH